MDPTPLKDKLGRAMLREAAESALRNPAWMEAPSMDARYSFDYWRKVSMALQAFLRAAIAERHFRCIGVFEDWRTAYPMLAYQAARICYGDERELTLTFQAFGLDLRSELRKATKTSGVALQRALKAHHDRLVGGGMQAVAGRRYHPRWYQDVIVFAIDRPKPLSGLLRAESTLIEAVIKLGARRSDRSPDEAAYRFGKCAGAAVRRIYGMPAWDLGQMALEETTRVMERLP